MKLFGSQIIKEKFLVEQPHWKYWTTNPKELFTRIRTLTGRACVGWGWQIKSFISHIIGKYWTTNPKELCTRIHTHTQATRGGEEGLTNKIFYFTCYKKQGKLYSEIIITRTTVLITSWFCPRWKLFQADHWFIWIIYNILQYSHITIHMLYLCISTVRLFSFSLEIID